MLFTFSNEQYYYLLTINSLFQIKTDNIKIIFWNMAEYISKRGIYILNKPLNVQALKFIIDAIKLNVTT